MRDRRLAVVVRWCGGGRGDGRIQAVEDEEVALGVVEGGERGNAPEMVEGGEGFHLVVFDVVPGDVPAGAVGANAHGEVHGAEIVAYGGEASHEGEVRTADGGE